MTIGKTLHGWLAICAVAIALAASPRAMAADQDDAALAARGIVTSLQQRQFEKLWNEQTSEFFKARLTKDSFLANMSLGRQQFGAAMSSTFIDMAYSQFDPGSGLRGEIYAFNYLNVYAGGKFFERIVVLKEKDGKFRLSGLWGTPAPQ